MCVYTGYGFKLMAMSLLVILQFADFHMLSLVSMHGALLICGRLALKQSCEMCHLSLKCAPLIFIIFDTLFFFNEMCCCRPFSVHADLRRIKT